MHTFRKQRDRDVCIYVFCDSSGHFPFYLSCLFILPVKMKRKDLLSNRAATNEYVSYCNMRIIFHDMILILFINPFVYKMSKIKY